MPTMLEFRWGAGDWSFMLLLLLYVQVRGCTIRQWNSPHFHSQGKRSFASVTISLLWDEGYFGKYMVIWGGLL